jgi:SnoaL-like polyketide cyclase
MPFDVEQLLRLWTDRIPVDDAAAVESFRQMYADPVTVNGAPLTAADLVARARGMQSALEGLEPTVLAVADAGGSIAVAFRLTGRQVGSLDTPAGRLPATGRPIDVRIIDILTFSDGLIAAIWMVADWLTALADADVLRLSTHPDQPAAPAGAPVGTMGEAEIDV